MPREDEIGGVWTAVIVLAHFLAPASSNMSRAATRSVDLMASMMDKSKATPDVRAKDSVCFIVFPTILLERFQTRPTSRRNAT